MYVFIRKNKKSFRRIFHTHIPVAFSAIIILWWTMEKDFDLISQRGIFIIYIYNINITKILCIQSTDSPATLFSALNVFFFCACCLWYYFFLFQCVSLCILFQLSTIVVIDMLFKYSKAYIYSLKQSYTRTHTIRIIFGMYSVNY